MGRFKIILALVLMQIGFVMNGQSVDSASANYSNDTLSIHIEGNIFIRDPDGLKRISDTIVSDSVLVDVIFLPCSPLQMYSPYDTTFRVTGTFAKGLNHLRLYTILYKDTIGSCYGYTSNQIVDTVNLSFNVPLSISETRYIPRVRLFPNPTQGPVSIKYEGTVDNIAILNSTGGAIKTFSPIETKLDISDFSPGIYVLQFYIDGRFERHKLIKI